MVTARIAGSGHSVPDGMDQHQLWEEFFDHHYGGNRTARRIWSSAGVSTRHGVVDPRIEDVSGWSTGTRMARFAREALPLGREAVSAALADSGMTASDVGLLTVVSCTGYGTPGLDVLLARDLGMSSNVQRLFVGHMGCYAALPGLGAAGDFTASRSRPSVLLCLELPACTPNLRRRRPRTRGRLRTTFSRWLLMPCSVTPPPPSCCVPGEEESSSSTWLP